MAIAADQERALFEQDRSILVRTVRDAKFQALIGHYTVSRAALSSLLVSGDSPPISATVVGLWSGSPSMTETPVSFQGFLALARKERQRKTSQKARDTAVYAN